MDVTLPDTAVGRYSRVFENLQSKLFVAVFGDIPFFVGKFLRKFFYRFIFSDIKSGSEIAPGVFFYNPKSISLGHRVRVERFVRILNFEPDSKILLSDRVIVSQNVEIRVHTQAGKNGQIKIGSNTYIGPFSYLSGEYISIGKNCLIAPYVGIFANNHVFEDPSCPICEQGHTYQGIVIEDDCWIGAGTKILDGVSIGQGSVVGAGSVVTKDLPPYSVAVGVPAKVIKKRNYESQHWPMLPAELKQPT
ncbi:MAG: acyltransferase [Leptolyngbyaceae cyanobacterium SM2_5_2]|nr:acyltransferase [Leptolyngbyaceae cyanobacterium SM2_5_2]